MTGVYALTILILIIFINIKHFKSTFRVAFIFTFLFASKFSWVLVLVYVPFSIFVFNLQHLYYT